jgi:hypothetical protein
MASFLRPRRGKKATAISQGLTLKRGEFFVEVPDSGVGTGVGKIKMGDGSTSYTNLPYLVSTEDDKIGFTDTSAATDPSNNPTYLTNIAPGNNLKTVFTNLKQLVYNHNTQLAELNNDLTATVGVTDVPFKFEYDSASGKYGYRDGADTFRPFNDGSGGGSQSLGTGRSFNLKTLGISDYASLTVDNFVCEISTTSSRITNPNPYGASWSYIDYNYTQVIKSYDPSTGVLTLTGGYIYARANLGQTSSANCTITTWIVR